jgi:hypothetical protein
MRDDSRRNSDSVTWATREISIIILSMMLGLNWSLFKFYCSARVPHTTFEK